MASGLLTGNCKIFVVFMLFLMCFHIFTVCCVEFKVGDNNNWVVPSSYKNDHFYNDWASRNRFKPNDTLCFEYNKDSILVVTKEEYEKCQSPEPLFFSNNGNTTFTLDRPGLFYFISGVSGHCERGLKMIIKVLETENPSPPQPANQTVGPPKKSGAVVLHMAGALCTSNIVMCTLSFFGPFFM